MTVLFLVIILICVYFYVKKYISRKHQEEKQKVSEFLNSFKPSINSILGYVELLKNEENDVQTQEKYLGIIEFEAEKLMMLSEMGETPDIKETKVSTNCSEVVFLMCRSLAHDAKTKGIELNYHCNPNLYVDFETRKLCRVVSNLVDNSIKYSETGGKIDVTVKDNSDYVVIECEDTGVGIKPENMTKIFNKGFKEDDDLPGFGYGLSKVREIVSENGGHIKLESEYGKGTKITLKFRKSKENSCVESKSEILPTRAK